MSRTMEFVLFLCTVRCSKCLSKKKMHLLRKMLRTKTEYPSFDARVCSDLSPLQWFERSLHKSVVRSKCRRKSYGTIRRRTSARYMSFSRTSLSFSRTSIDFSALAKFDSLKLTQLVANYVATVCISYFEI